MKKRWYLLHIVITILLVLGFRAWTDKRPKSNVIKTAPSGAPSLPVSKPVLPADPFSPERLIAVGESVIFGTNAPRFDPNQGVPVGRGQCPACHVLLEGQQPNRFPRLIGVMARAGERIHEERYKMFARRYAERGEPTTGIRPHAQTAGEYLIESIYCPSCYVVQGLGVQGTEDVVSLMPVIHSPEAVPSDYEMVAIVSYLQAAEAQGDFSKVTARRDWENYFGRKLTVSEAPEEKPSPSASPEELSNISLSRETPEKIIEKMSCHMCHKIPTVSIAQVGLIGPVLTLKTTAAQRIRSPEYQRALKEGKVRATTPKEYVVESILNPGAFIVPGFDDAMPKNFKKRLTVGAVERLAEFLLTLDEEKASEQGSHPSPTGAENAAKTRD